MWIECEEVIGHGSIHANGGNGLNNQHGQGGGGAGGRIAISSNNINKLNITMDAYGGRFSLDYFRSYLTLCIIVVKWEVLLEKLVKVGDLCLLCLPHGGHRLRGRLVQKEGVFPPKVGGLTGMIE